MVIVKHRTVLGGSFERFAKVRMYLLSVRSRVILMSRRAKYGREYVPRHEHVSASAFDECGSELKYFFSKTTSESIS
jgi:hypothetical protein